jgi:hypothetical protein
MNTEPETEFIETANDVIFPNNNKEENEQIKFSVIEEKSKTEIETPQTNPEPESKQDVNTETVENFIQTIRTNITEYCKKTPVSVAILTPCYNGTCCISYLTSLIATIQEFSNVGIPIKIYFCKNDSLVTRARNNLIARAMTDKTVTHIMFIDSDIKWFPHDIYKLILSNKDVIGGAYPLKKYNFDRLAEENVVAKWIENKNKSKINLLDDITLIKSKLIDYNINHISNQLEIVDNLIQVRHSATGFLMIKRDVITNMAKAFPSTKYTDDIGFLSKEENENAYALFDCAVVDDHYYSEDWLFCHRWSKMNGKIYIDISIMLGHTGTEEFTGTVITSFI